MTLASVFAAIAVVSSQSVPEVVGFVSHRERMALPATAELVVSLDRFGPGLQELISEVRLKLRGRQVPIRYTLPYATVPPGAYGVRARLEDGGKVLFESPKATMIDLKGRVRADLLLVKAAHTEPQVLDKTWSVIAIESKQVSFEDRRPTLVFAGDGSVRGFSSVNQFSGKHEWKAPFVQIDPGAMTLMVGPPERMEVEASLMRVLPLANRLIVFEGQLLLQRGERILVVLEPSK